MIHRSGKFISILLAVFDPIYLIEDCINSFLSYTDFGELKVELVIIDNTKDGIWPLLASYNHLMSIRGVNLTYQRNLENHLHVESSNMALNISSGDYILFFNDDLEIPRTQSGWLLRMFRIIDEIPNCGIVTLSLLHRDHTIYWIGNGDDGEHLDYRKPFDFMPKDYYFDSPWINLACALVKRTIFDKVSFDGIDPKTGNKHTHYVADHFFGREIKALGFTNVVCRDTWIYHYNERKRPSELKKIGYQDKPKAEVIPIRPNIRKPQRVARRVR